VHNQLREALGRAEALADSLDRFQLDSAARRIHRDLAVVRPATEQEFAAMRAGPASGRIPSRSAPCARAPMPISPSGR